MSDVSIVCDVIDAMVTRFAAALPGVLVSDGPLLGDEAETRKLEIGVDDPDSSRRGAQAATSDLDWAGLGNRARDELLRVRCAASARSGGTVMKTVRDAAYALVSAVQADLKATPVIGGCLYSLVKDLDLKQGFNPDGAVAQFTFTIHVRARLTV